MRAPLSPATDLPALYRVVLDAVGELERAGERAEAGRVRNAATEAYSTSWNEDGLKRLEQLAARCRDALEETRRSRPRPRRLR